MKALRITATGRGLDRGEQGCQTESALVLQGIDEEGGHGNDTAANAPLSAPREPLPGARVPACRAGTGGRPGRRPSAWFVSRSRPEAPLVLEHPVVDLPELSLGPCGLRRLGGALGLLGQTGLREKLRKT